MEKRIGNVINKHENKEKVKLTDNFLKMCYDEMKKDSSYDRFLLRKGAIKIVGGRIVALKADKDSLSSYENKLLPQSLDDSFAFYEMAKIMASDGSGKNQYETGYFCPKMFWDNVLNQLRKHYKFNDPFQNYSEENKEKVQAKIKQLTPEIMASLGRLAEKVKVS